jgi:NAD(P)-dependent dehydrogenase (short-subunit alcohol dehydrogenase family)
MTGRVLITGGSRGIGAAIARRFAADGWRVAVHFHASPDAAAEVLDSLEGSGHVGVRADLRDPEAITRMVQEAADAMGAIDVLVNNAGVFVDHPIDEVDFDTWLEAWRQTLDINLLAPAIVSWHAVRHMGRGGRIINVGSRGAFRGEPHSPAYGASKAGLSSFGQSLAKYLGSRGIAVTTVAPGFVETDMAAAAMEGEAGEVRRAESPFGRIAHPDEIAAAIAFLASPEAEWASGGILDLNGASYLRM